MDCNIEEKNGVFALFLLFSLFDCIMAWQTGASPNVVMLAVTAVSGVGYVILKYVKQPALKIKPKRG